MGAYIGDRSSRCAARGHRRGGSGLADVCRFTWSRTGHLCGDGSEGQQCGPGAGGLDSMTGVVAIRRTEEEEGVNPTGSGGRVRQCENCSAPPASAAAVGGDTRATGSAVERGFFFNLIFFLRKKSI